MEKNEKRRRNIQITITENCNLNCIYCYEKRKDKSVMSLECIKEKIKWAFEASENYDEIEFSFHGGEIALVFDRLKEACEWLWSQETKIPYICFACTNGTLIHGEIKDWFKKNSKRFWLGISLDGTREMHNINRSNSYDQIDFEFFRKTWPEQGIKMTVSPKSIHTLADGIKNVHKLGFKLSFNLAYGIKWDESLLKIYARELRKIADFYLENPNLQVPSLFSVGLKTIGMYDLCPERKVVRKFCGSGTDMVCFGCDGKQYPCQTFMPSTDAKEGDKVFSKIDFDLATTLKDPQCENCPFIYACPTCYGHNYMATGTLHLRPKDLCSFRKVEAFASSYLLGKMLLDYESYPLIKNFSEFERKCLARGILIIQESFKDFINDLEKIQ